MIDTFLLMDFKSLRGNFSGLEVTEQRLFLDSGRLFL